MPLARLQGAVASSLFPLEFQQLGRVRYAFYAYLSGPRTYLGLPSPGGFVSASHASVTGCEAAAQRIDGSRTSNGEPRVSKLQSRYLSMVQSGQIEADPAQAAAVRRLDALVEAIDNSRLARKSSALGWLFGSKAETAKPPRGLYIWGSVGRGKTMLMDMFFAEVSAQRKRRVHFHDFMADAHSRIHQWRQLAKEGRTQGSEPIAAVAEALAGEAWVLCFDEFAVNDIADAMILDGFSPRSGKKES